MRQEDAVERIIPIQRNSQRRYLEEGCKKWGNPYKKKKKKQQQQLEDAEQQLRNSVPTF